MLGACIRLATCAISVAERRGGALLAAAAEALLRLAAVLDREAGLADLPELKATAEGATRLRNGNPGMVLAAGGIEYGDEAWASHDGRPVAVGRYKAGELHPVRVFNLPDA